MIQNNDEQDERYPSRSSYMNITNIRHMLIGEDHVLATWYKRNVLQNICLKLVFPTGVHSS